MSGNSINRLCTAPACASTEKNVAFYNMYCKNCGIKVEEKSSFCSQCGNPLKNSEISRAASTESAHKSEEYKDIKRYWLNYKIGFWLVFVLTVGLISNITSRVPAIENQGEAGAFVVTIMILPFGTILMAILTARSSYKLSNNKKSLLKGLFGFWPFPFPLGIFFAFFATMDEYKKAIGKPFSKIKVIIFWSLFFVSTLYVLDALFFTSQASVGTLFGIY